MLYVKMPVYQYHNGYLTPSTYLSAAVAITVLCVHDIAFTVKVVAMLIIMAIIDINI